MQQLKNFSEHFENIKIGLTGGSFHILSEYENIHLGFVVKILNDCHYDYCYLTFRHEDFYLYKSIFLFINLELLEHLIEHSLDIQNHRYLWVPAICFNFDLDVLIKYQHLYDLNRFIIQSQCISALFFRALLKANKIEDINKVYEFLEYLENYNYDPYANMGLTDTRPVIVAAKKLNKVLQKRFPEHDIRLYDIIKNYAIRKNVFKKSTLDKILERIRTPFV